MNETLTRVDLTLAELAAESAEQAVACLLGAWHEESGPQVVRVIDEDARLLARVETAIQHNDYDATVEVQCEGPLQGWWRVWYVLDADGMYGHTHITRLGWTGGECDLTATQDVGEQLAALLAIVKG